MKVLLTGATGFVGGNISERLRSEGHELTCLVRDPKSAGAQRLLTDFGVRLMEGDVLDPDSLARAAAGVDAVVHLVGIIFQSSHATFENVHTRGTQNAIAAAQSAGARRFVFMSALGTGPEARSAYHRTKWAAEEAIRNSGLDYTIMRPSIIYGRGGEFIKMLTGQIKVLPLVPVIGNGRYRMQPVWVDDVASCFAAALGKPAAIGQTYEIGGPEQITYVEMIDTIAAVMGKRRIKLYIPVFMVKPVAWLSERVLPKPLLTMDQLRMLLNDNVCDISRMRAELGVDPVPFEQGLADVITRGHHTNF